MNSEKDKLSRSDTLQNSPESVQTEQSAAAPPVPKRRRHYYNGIPTEIPDEPKEEAAGQEEPEAAEQKPEEAKPAKQQPAEPNPAERKPFEFEPVAAEIAEAGDDYDYPDGYRPDPPNKKAMTAAIAVAVVIAAAVLVFLIYLIISNLTAEKPASSSTPDSAVETTAAASTQLVTENAASKIVTMPELSGMTESEAYELLNQAGIKYKVARVFSETVLFNRVVSQFPVSGTEVSLDEEAILYLSKGKEHEIIESTTKPRETKATQPKSTAPSTNEDYILSESASRRLTLSDIKDLDRETLNLALNEIFARHGRKFSDPDINAYFRSKSWYSGTIASKDFDMSILNQYETYNVNLISNYQTEMGYR